MKKKHILSICSVIFILFGCEVLPENIIRYETVYEETKESNKLVEQSTARLSEQAAMLIALKQAPGTIIKCDFYEDEQNPHYKITIKDKLNYEFEISAIDGSVIINSDYNKEEWKIENKLKDKKV